MNLNNNKKIINNIIDYILFFLLIVLSLKKGGFYKADTLFFNLGVCIIAIISIINSYIYNVNEDNKSKNKIGILLLVLATAFLIPVLIGNYSSLNDAIFEMIRYYNVYLIYMIVSKSFNKNKYIYIIIAISIMLSILGVDQIASGYLVGILSNISSGYLTSNNLDRMSSTIQYANVFAIICAISLILKTNLKHNQIKSKNIFKKSLMNLVDFILLSSIFLSYSRMVIFLVMVNGIIYFMKNKIEVIKWLPNIIFMLFYVSLVNNLISNNSQIIYILTIIMYIFVYIIYCLLYKYSYKIKESFNVICSKNNRIYIMICVISVILFLALLIVNLKIDVVLDSKSNKTYTTKNIYNINYNEENKLCIEIDELEEDTRYEIEIFQVNKNNVYTLEKKLYYYLTSTGIFDIKLKPVENLSHINVNINCTKGKLKVSNIIINNNEINDNYLLLPSNLLNRIRDGISSKDSYSLRLEYVKDALKISTNSIKNFIFGIGGEGFRNEYKYFKTSNYSSTEVHNIYIQILLESGIIAFIIIVILIIYVLMKSKFNYIKVALILLLIHGMVDLDFSYMLVLSIFAILIGLLEIKDNKNENSKSNSINVIKNILNYLESILCISLMIICVFIVFKAYLALNQNISNIAESDSITTILDKVSYSENKVKLDSFEPKYRINLNEMYINYLDRLDVLMAKSDLEDLKVEYKNVLLNFISNLEYLQNNESWNTSNVLEISNQYFNNLNKIVDIKYTDKDAGYDYYLNIIYNNMLKLYNVNDNNLKEKVKYICKRYSEELSYNNYILLKYKELFEKIGQS